MNRNYKEIFRPLVDEINQLLGRPAQMFASSVEESPLVWNIGHIFIDKNSSGYLLEEIVGPTGATRSLAYRMSGRDMDIALRSIISGISLRNSSTE